MEWVPIFHRINLKLNYCVFVLKLIVRLRSIIYSNPWRRFEEQKYGLRHLFFLYSQINFYFVYMRWRRLYPNLRKCSLEILLKRNISNSHRQSPGVYQVKYLETNFIPRVQIQRVVLRPKTHRLTSRRRAHDHSRKRVSSKPSEGWKLSRKVVGTLLALALKTAEVWSTEGRFGKVFIKFHNHQTIYNKAPRLFKQYIRYSSFFKTLDIYLLSFPRRVRRIGKRFWKLN